MKKEYYNLIRIGFFTLIIFTFLVIAMNKVHETDFKKDCISRNLTYIKFTNVNAFGDDVNFEYCGNPNNFLELIKEQLNKK
jgi:hypothetical protein